jgi:hypothetical protein
LRRADFAVADTGVDYTVKCKVFRAVRARGGLLKPRAKILSF